MSEHNAASLIPVKVLDSFERGVTTSLAAEASMPLRRIRDGVTFDSDAVRPLLTGDLHEGGLQQLVDELGACTLVALDLHASPEDPERTVLSATVCGERANAGSWLRVWLDRNLLQDDSSDYTGLRVKIGARGWPTPSQLARMSPSDRPLPLQWNFVPRSRLVRGNANGLNGKEPVPPDDLLHAALGLVAAVSTVIPVK